MSFLEDFRKLVIDLRHEYQKSETPIVGIVKNLKLPTKASKKGYFFNDENIRVVCFKEIPGNDEFVMVHSLHHKPLGVLSVSPEIWVEILDWPETTKQEYKMNITLFFNP